jgi:hypothetical protein
MAFLSVGIAWLLQRVFHLLSNVGLAYVFGLTFFWNNFPGITASILVAVASLLAIVVSYSLVRGGKFEGKTLKLSSVAIIIYSAALLLTYSLGVYSTSLFISIDLPERIRDAVGYGLSEGLIYIAHLISLLAIGLMLYRIFNRSKDRF